MESLTYKDKSKSSLWALDLRHMIINRRTGRPTTLSLVLGVMVCIVLLSAMARQSTSPTPAKTKTSSGKGFNVNPRLKAVALFKAGFKHDPQDAEFKRIMEGNLKGDRPPVIPVFDSNVKRGMVKKPALKGAELADRPRPKDFPVALVQSPNVTCSREELPLLLLVLSEAGNTGARTAIRKTWGMADANSRWPWKTVFVMGRSNRAIDHQVALENQRHADILQGAFPDSQYEGTRKVAMSLRWATGKTMLLCKPKYILKSEDNIYHNMPAIIQWLERKFGEGVKTPLYMGKLLHQDRPNRDPENHYYVPPSDFIKDVFPDMIQGPVYLLNAASLSSLALAMGKVVPIAVEDAYVGVLASKAHIRPQHNDHFQMLRKTGNICHHLKMFFIYKLMPSEHVEIFKSNKLARQHPDCLGAAEVNGENQKHDIVL